VTLLVVKIASERRVKYASPQMVREKVGSADSLHPGWCETHSDICILAPYCRAIDDEVVEDRMDVYRAASEG